MRFPALPQLYLTAMAQSGGPMNASLVFTLLMLGLTAGLSTVLAQSAGTFTATGDMSTPRFGHSATLLPNGNVLMAGGESNTGTAATAELYDPASGVFSATGSMIVARSGHSATLVPNGKVLIAGGRVIGSRILNSAELYDPATGIFTAAGEMTVPRAFHRAILLADGEVLMVGGDGAYGITNIFGCNPSGPYPSHGLTFEIYDPQFGRFRPAGPFIGGEFGLLGSATLLADGRILIAPYYFGPPALYDQRTSTCANTNFGSPRFLGSAAVLLPGGKVLFAGGNDDPGPTTGAELFDPATGSFDPTGSLNEARADHMAVQLSDGQVLIAGGSLVGGRTLAGAELYDPAAGAFRVTGVMNTSRSNATSTLLPDGRVLIAGGIHNESSGSGPIVASAEIYHPAVGIPSPRLFSVIDDGRAGQGAIWHADTGQIASVSNPAAAGEALSMYTASLIHGAVVPPQIAIGDRLAEILFFGDAPGYPGYYQVNFRVPGGVAPAAAVPVRLTYIGRPSNVVTIGVK